jgi:hypothetical protein
VAALKDRSSRSVGNALLRILLSAVLPEILQSDNGKEFLGHCIKFIKEEFHTIKVVEKEEDEEGEEKEESSQLEFAQVESTPI